MKRASGSYEKGLTLTPESQDDLWQLSQVIEAGDTLSGRTLRKMKTGTQEDRNQKAAKIPVFIKIKVERVELSESLRVLGTVLEGPDDIPHGEHHSFVLSPHSSFTLEKEAWLSYQKEKVEQACSRQQAPLLLAVHDREEAYIAQMKGPGYEVLAHLEGNVAKKGMDEGMTRNFYQEILTKLAELDARLEPSAIIIASPAFWKEELLKHLSDPLLRKKIVLATCSSVGKEAFDEVLKREEVRQALAESRAARELNLVESLLREISLGDKASYGRKHTLHAIRAGAAQTVLLTDSFISREREAGAFPEVEEALRQAEKQKGSVHLISSQHQGGEKLDGLGGIGAILRYPLPQA